MLSLRKHVGINENHGNIILFYNTIVLEYLKEGIVFHKYNK